MARLISAILVVHDEERRIRPCFESLKGVVDEIVVVHDGKCSDKTLDIAKEYSAKIFVRNFVGEAEPHRIFSFEQCKGDWIFQIDADERLSNELCLQLRSLACDSSVDAYAFRWEDPEEVCIFGIFPIKKYKPCFFRKSKISFSGLVHEPTGTSGILCRSELLLLHRPGVLLSDHVVFKKKTEYWSRIAAKTLVEKDLVRLPAFFYAFKAPVWAMVYLLFYLVFRLHMFAGKNGWWVAKYHATYNFLLNYNIYKLKK